MGVIVGRMRRGIGEVDARWLMEVDDVDDGDDDGD